ncbi:ionotropic receptor 75a-like isoform X3 [Tenebrio molitor]|uniref:ionotropic receptor 75a-like isoform X3 n=1 Tax=Tenebrio molitor TaxID=7067 RepID=UPI0036246FEA
MNSRTFLICLIFIEISTCKIVLPMINDFVEHYNKTQIVLGFVCRKNDALKLVKHFSKKLHQVKAVSVDTRELPYPIPPTYVTFVLDGQCSGAKHLLLRADAERLFATPFKWIVSYDYSYDVADLIENFTELNLLVDSDVTVAIMENRETFSLQKIYKRHVNGSMLVENIGNWTKRHGFVDNGYEKIIYKRRRDLKKTILNSCIVITNNDSLNHLTDKRDIHIDSIAKVNYVLVEHLSDTVNAVLNYSVRGTWGYKNNESKWSGMIGELTRNEADIGGTALFLTSDRIEIIDYIAMTTPTRSKFIFRQPKLSYVANVFTLPFDGLVWASTCALLLIMAMVLYVVVKWEWKKKKYVEIANESNDIEIPNSWVEVTFTTVAVLCQQGSSSIPFSIPGRITLIFLLVSLMFLYTSYSANIVALLQSSSNSIQTLQDILHSRLDVGVDNTVFNHFYFPNATEPVRRALYLQKVAPPGQKPKFYSIDEGIRRMREGLFAFHVETGPGYKFVRARKVWSAGNPVLASARPLAGHTEKLVVQKNVESWTSIASRERDSRQRGRFDLHQKAAVPVDGQQLHKCGVGGLLPCSGGARRRFGGGCDGFVARNIRQSQVVTRLSKIRLHII